MSTQTRPVDRCLAQGGRAHRLVTCDPALSSGSISVSRGGSISVSAKVHVVENFPVSAVAPWRIGQPLTGGMVAQWLRVEFTGLQFRDGFDRKSQKFTFPEARGDPRLLPG